MKNRQFCTQKTPSKGQGTPAGGQRGVVGVPVQLYITPHTHNSWGWGPTSKMGTANTTWPQLLVGDTQN